MKISDIIALFIQSKWNERIYGIQGTPIMLLFLSIYNQGIKIITNSTENNTIYSAIGEYDDSKKVQFVVLTMWPGVLGALKWMGNAYINKVPIIYIIPHNRRKTDGMWEHHSIGYGEQSINIENILSSVTVYGSRLSHEDLIIPILHKIYDIALEKNQPVFLSIPYDMFELDTNYLTVHSPTNTTMMKSILIIWHETTAQEVQYIESKGIAYFFIGDKLLPHHISKMYMWSFLSYEDSFFKYLLKNRYFHSLVLFKISGDYYNLSFLSYGSNDIYISHTSTKITDKLYFLLWKDIGYQFEKDISIVEFLDEKIFLGRELFLQQETYMQDISNPYYDFVKFMNTVELELSVFISVWSIEDYSRQFLMNKRQEYFFPSIFLDMGQFTTAVWYGISNPDKILVCLVGDGNLCMNLWELQTIADYWLNIHIVLFNNKGYNSLRERHKNIYEIDEDLPKQAFHQYVFDTDYKAIANAYGFLYQTVGISELSKKVSFSSKRTIFEITELENQD